MTRDFKLYIEDISDAIKEVEKFIEGLSFEEFSEDIKVIRAVTMGFIIIGEAAKHIPLEIRKNRPVVVSFFRFKMAGKPLSVPKTINFW